MFVIQYLAYPSWEHKWFVSSEKYKTLKEAQEAFNALPFKADHRIMEEYTVTRYKAVKA